MNTTIELASGKVIALNRFVALVPDQKTTEGTYSLILEGSKEAIALNYQEMLLIKKHLKLSQDSDLSNNWDREAQIRKNQPAIELLKKRIARNQLMSEEESHQRAEFLTNFQKTVDEQRVSERKLYSPE